VGKWLSQLPLTTGPLFVAITVIGACALSFLVASDRRSLRWWTVLAAAVGSVVIVALGRYVVDDVLQPWPERLTWPTLVWAEIAFLGVVVMGLRITGLRERAGRGWRLRVAWVAAGVLVFAWGLNNVNRDYGYLPTVGALIGRPPANTVTLPPPPPVAPIVEIEQLPEVGLPLEQTFTPPPDMPANGKVVADTPIPGMLSGFNARPAWLYLPPAYFTPNPPPLPVLVLIAGQPGVPRNWIDGGRVAGTMDAFAARHHGLAPIVVVPDPLGSTLANPLCMDSRLGMTETYLSRDVPLWVKQNLSVNPDPSAWAIGGFSFGGTCALQLAVRAPDVFRTFVDISGQDEPTLGNHAKTVQAAFGGDEAAFRLVNPADVMAHQTFPDTVGYFAAGVQDVGVVAALHRLDDEAVRSGMHTGWVEVPGLHSWVMAAQALELCMPRLAERLKLTAP
jgi:S-formylglutathione hydrolase FrmB